MNTDAIADLRKSYELAALNESESLADPRLQFERWLQEAIRLRAPCCTPIHTARNERLCVPARVLVVKPEPEQDGLESILLRSNAG